MNQGFSSVLFLLLAIAQAPAEPVTSQTSADREGLRPSAAAEAPPATSLQPPSTAHRSQLDEVVSDASTIPGAPMSAPEPMVVREPSQGRPIFIEPDNEFYFVMRLTPKLTGSDVAFTLVHSREPTIRVPLWATTPPSFVANQFASLVLKVPGKVAPGLYDLEVHSKAAAYRSRHCVRVVDRFKTKFRFVHLSNMNVGDLTAPDFDDMLPAEVNLLAPEFIVATGDFTEWARARNDASSWTRVLEYLARFDAPVFVVCGSHDHEDSFSQLVASSPIGTVDYGNYHGLLLLDHPAHPIETDYDQLRWIDADLQKNRNRAFSFVVMRSDELALLDVWRERGRLAEFVDRHHIKSFITGGSTDWDGVEFKEKLADLKDFHFIRTHQSSTCLRDRATGVSHYRVIEVDGDRISYNYPDDVACEAGDHSIPAGRLRLFLDRPNDGSADQLIATVQNGLNQPIDSAHLWLRVLKPTGGTLQPVVAGGRLVRAVDAGRYWACDVEVNLPEKGAVRVLASNSPGAVPPEVPVTATIEGPIDLAFTAKETKFGLRYYGCESALNLALRNNSKERVTCWPVARLNGAKLHLDPKGAPRLPLTIEPGATATLPLRLDLRRVSDGPHQLQVHFLEDPLCRLTTFPVNLRGTGGKSAQDNPASEKESLTAAPVSP